MRLKAVVQAPGGVSYGNQAEGIHQENHAEPVDKKYAVVLRLM